jgi:uncharacterized protein (TIGR02246 family)
MKFILTFALLLVMGKAFSQDKESAKIYILNANIVDVENQKILTGSTVVIEGNRIAFVGQMQVPPNAKFIDATGKYLMPGMVDAHVHFFQSGGLYTRPDIIDLRSDYTYQKEIKWAHDNFGDQLRRYIQNGITTVFDVGATNNFLKQKNDFANKSYVPQIYMAGPLLTSVLLNEFKDMAKDDQPFILFKTPKQAAGMVRQQLPYKPDLIKIWYLTDLGNHKSVAENARNLLPSVIAMINEAHKNRLKVAVHATERITAQLAVQAGADYLVHGVDDEIIKDDFVRLLKKNHTVLCPTLMVDDGYENTFGQTLQFSKYEIAKSNPFQLGSLLDLKHLPDSEKIKLYKKKSISIRAKTNTRDSIRIVNVAKLVNAGVTVVTGTDAGNIGTLHATSYFTELKLMQQSGMSNWQIIQASTTNGAKILNKENDFGVISAGKMANMILLNGNPVSDINNLQKIQLVINRGDVIDPDTLVHITPEALVQQQLNAYNAHNLEAFLETYADDVELYDFPGKLVCKGKEQMRKIYSFLNNSPDLHCQVKATIIQGATVIYKELVTGVSDLGESTAIYQTENGKIKKVYFIN